MAVCTEKPGVPLGIIGLDAVGDPPHHPRHKTSSAAVHPPMSQQASMYGFKPDTPGVFTTGNFSIPTSKMTAEERFVMSQPSTSSTTTGSGLMSRIDVQDGPGSNRKRSKRGGERNESKKVHDADVSNNQVSSTIYIRPMIS